MSERLGVSKPTLYYYIKNKDDILFQCSRMALSDMHDTLQEIIRHGIEDKSIADCNPQLTTFAIFGAYNWVCHWYDKDGNLSADDIKESFMMKGLDPR